MSNDKEPPTEKHRHGDGRGGIVETKGLARWAEAKKADGARSSKPRTPMIPQ